MVLLLLLLLLLPEREVVEEELDWLPAAAAAQVVLSRLGFNVYCQAESLGSSLTRASSTSCAKPLLLLLVETGRRSCVIKPLETQVPQQALRVQ